MEDVLALYHEPYDETRPVICFDENLARHFVGMNAIRSRPNRERSLGSIIATNVTGNSGYTSLLNR